MSSRRVSIAVVCAVAASTAGAIAVHRAHGTPPSALTRFSTQGRSVKPSRDAARALKADSMQLLAVRDGRAFYEVDSARGRCFAVGSSEAIGDPGGEICPAGAPFPSADRPVLDFSVYEARSGADRDQVTIFRIEGFAADGVTAVGVLNRAQRISLRVPVLDNVYVVDPVPPGLTGRVVPLPAPRVPR
jgi:hypothetical protein